MLVISDRTRALQVAPATAAPTLASLEELTRAKVQQEVLALTRQNQRSPTLTDDLGTLTPVLSAGGVLIATLWGVGKYFADQTSARNAAADDGFRQTVAALGSTVVAAQATAAGGLRVYLGDGYERLHHQVAAVAAVSLTVAATDIAVKRILVVTLARALQTHLATCAPATRDDLLQLSRTFLLGAPLSGLDLTAADLAFADLSYAELSGSRLVRIRGYAVRFHRATLDRANLHEARLRAADAQGASFLEARLGGTRLEDAHLRGANFNSARAQSAHFNAADLTGATFSGADLNDAWFTGATLDDVALQSIARGARNWRKAHFDPEHQRRLDALA